jgi:hypothetical protein
MTIKELARFCVEQLGKGNGDKKIVISDDNEGNGYHGLFYGFTEISKQEYASGAFPIYDSQEDDPDKIIILG